METIRNKDDLYEWKDTSGFLSSTGHIAASFTQGTATSLALALRVTLFAIPRFAYALYAHSGSDKKLSEITLDLFKADYSIAKLAYHNFFKLNYLSTNLWITFTIKRNELAITTNQAQVASERTTSFSSEKNSDDTFASSAQKPHRNSFDSETETASIKSEDDTLFSDDSDGALFSEDTAASLRKKNSNKENN
jgi:hypothetical protein